VAQFLVTGGAGFIGSNLAEALLRRGDDVRVLDDFSTGRRSNLKSADEWASAGGGRFELVEGDLRDEEVRRRAMDGAEYVLHQAAVPSVQRSVQEPGRTNDVNLTGTLALLEAARAVGVKRFVFASSSSLYGDAETLPKEEGMAPNPISPYGLQKLTGETYCRLFHRLYEFPTVALRYFNVFGPRQDPGSEYSAVIPRFIAAIRDGQNPMIYGDGEQTRDFTFIANVVSANLLACEAGPGALGQAFNVACGQRVSLNELVRQLGALMHRDVQIDYAEARAGDIKHSLAAIERARLHLGYSPEVTMQDGLRRTLELF